MSYGTRKEKIITKRQKKTYGDMDEINFKKVSDYLFETGNIERPDYVYVGIPDAKKMLMKGIQFFTDNKGVWLPEYDAIADWLEGNNGRGLFCIGSVGRGKTLICTKVIPTLLNWYHRKVVSIYDAQQMNANIDDVLSKHIVCIDDLGTENESVKYGERRMAFAELADTAEKKGKLLIITTNMSLNELREKYSERVVDRLRAITKAVLFDGKSLRE